jgi:hypothetical protein
MYSQDIISDIPQRLRQRNHSADSVRNSSEKIDEIGISIDVKIT